MPYGMQFVKKELHFQKDSPQPPQVIVNTLHSMKQLGFRLGFKRWRIEEGVQPGVIYFEIESAKPKLNDWKQDFATCIEVSLSNDNTDLDDAIKFGFLTVTFLEELLKQFSTPTYIVAHYHNWRSAVGPILCRKRCVNVSTIFTAHGTLVGRYLCATFAGFYKQLCKKQDKVKFDFEREFGKLPEDIHHIFKTERTAIHCAHIFTTASNLTGLEAKLLLDKEPNIITPNGINFSTVENVDIQARHSVAKQKIDHFVESHFHGHYKFDLDKTLYIFTTGQEMLINNGYKFFIEALRRLNYFFKGDTCKATGKEITIVAFILAKTNECNQESLVQANTSINVLPSVCTHNVDETDEILCALKNAQLFNDCSDKVKIIYHPGSMFCLYSLFGLKYEEFVCGCHLGVFPSCYEPWGYDPEFCLSMGTPVVISNISGFGCFMMENYLSCSNGETSGVFLMDRICQKQNESINQLTEILSKLLFKDRINFNNMQKLIRMLDWENLGFHYQNAREMAFRQFYADSCLPLPSSQTIVLGSEDLSQGHSDYHVLDFQCEADSDENGDEGDDDWCEDTSDAAVQARQSNMSANAKTLTVCEELEKSQQERIDIFYSFVKQRKVAGGVTGAEKEKEIVLEAERLEIKDKAPMVLAELLFDANMTLQIKQYRSLFLRFTQNNEKAQRYLLGGFEQLVGKVHPDVLLPKVSKILSEFYEHDILAEDVIIDWDKKPSKKYVSKEVSKEIHANAEKFIEWLKNAEEESDEDEEEEDDDDDDNLKVVYDRNNSADKPTVTTIQPAAANHAQDDEDDEDEDKAEEDDLNIDDI